jgi:glycosyltransferase involved in cell wall biosynthesis
MPLVSFIIPTIGRKKLDQAVGSLLDQTDPDWEVIIVTDGLDSVGKKHVEFLCEYDERLRFYHLFEKNGGGHPCNNGRGGLVRNRAFNFVKGEWVAFLDDDDTVSCDYVAAVRAEGQDNDLLVFRMAFPDGRVLPPVGTYDLGEGNVGISYAVRNSFLKQYKINFVNDEVEDFLFLTSCLVKGAKYKVSDTVAYYVRWDGIKK